MKSETNKYIPVGPYGVRLETLRFSRFWVDKTFRLAQVISFVKPLNIEGTVPTHGPFMVVSNHSHWLDGPLTLIAVGRVAGRSSHIVARDTLDPDTREEKEVLERTGKKADLLNSIEPRSDFVGVALNRVKYLGRKGLVWFVEKGDPLWIHRGDPAEEQTRAIMDTFEAGRGVVIFIEETRNSNLLERPMDGPASIARRMHLERGIRVPIIPTFVDAKNLTVRFGQSRIWEDFRREMKERNPDYVPYAHNLTLALADDIKRLAAKY